MALRLREVDFDRDCDELLDVLRRNLPEVDHASRFAWLYQNNPGGRSRAWFVCEESGRAVGTTSVFPRKMWVRGQAVTCGQVGNFAVDLAYRVLGPAVQLQKATFLPVDEGQMAFVYDCPPHDKGMAPFLRLGMRANTRMQRFVRLLSTAGMLSRTLHSQTLGRLGAIAADPALSIWQSTRKPAHVSVSEIDADFGPEFVHLDRPGGPDAIRGVRSPEILNWRFRRDPVRRYRILVARTAEAVAGYAVMTVGDAPVLADLHAPEAAGVAAELVAAACKLSRPAHNLQSYVSDSAGPMIDGLQAAHFHYRSDGPAVVAYFGKQAQAEKFQWQMFGSDISA